MNYRGNRKKRNASRGKWLSIGDLLPNEVEEATRIKQKQNMKKQIREDLEAGVMEYIEACDHEIKDFEARLTI